MGKTCCVSFWYLTLALKLTRILGVLLAFNQGSALADVLAINSQRQSVKEIENLTLSGTRLLTSQDQFRQIPMLTTGLSKLNQLRLDPILSQVLDSEPKQPIPIPQPQPEPTLELPPQTFPSSEEGLDLPESIIVRKFEFDGNTAFSDEKLTEVTAQFTKRSLTFVELLEVEATITKLYTDAGYINCGAVIPAGQTLSQQGSVVKIQIIEGGLEEIAVTGTRRLNSNYIRSRLAIATARPLNQKRLLSALQLLQLDPLIQNISAELSAGSRPELSLLTVKVIEADSFNTEFFIDNSRAPSVGSLRRGVRINEGNLFGFGDGLNLEYINTDGSNAFDFRYNIPVNPRNGTITLRGGLTSTEIVEPPFDRLDIIGNSNYFELGFRQPLILSPNREFAVGLSALRQESKSELLGMRVPLSAGANEQGETRIFALQFFQEYQQRNSQQALALRSQFNLGLDIFNATVNNEPPDSRFFSWRGQGQYVRLLAPQTLLVIRSDLQLTTRALVPLEQFGLGGLRSIRGYRQDILLTDNGFLASAEVQLPVLRVEKVGGVLQVVPFIDFGVGWNSSGNADPNPNTLLGLGLGLQWQMGDRLNARLDYGIPLTDIQDRGRTLQEDGIYFSIVANPF
ncbi:ShlB/FhaC/HecB family hemolysin secretion/activation protein [Nostoc sphaeroides]|uniref:ShlB/FhaC/HecB family hemolysin secretion/activation protein n=1 Tax=Nostoc sphaeroides CCNUC1 TaxID=2653204 RepID=A0A5P8WBT3_9NOSO|nr:ShlB/FhaC/HecB family hemolysin secretion/activation protein [Nostoc sphaeroides]MCC5632152.1 BamA/TamA family outer membrane protein [Nostoc sphaeroides CHAB 2801]QFS50074.1 ShlB/FhaC/HecB family hemolysin secretion/activation protein [Nostoc sphaeroides CCNUC1]